MIRLAGLPKEAIDAKTINLFYRYPTGAVDENARDYISRLPAIVRITELLEKEFREIYETMREVQKSI